MGKSQYLIDSNVVIDYLGGHLPPNAMELMHKIVDATPRLSIISKIEILAYNFPTKQSFEITKDFINSSLIYNLNGDIVETTIELRKNFRIKLPDAIIAATALVNNFELITRNTKDFKKIKSLKVMDPFDL
jgi:hypothetical protein